MKNYPPPPPFSETNFNEIIPPFFYTFSLLPVATSEIYHQCFIDILDVYKSQLPIYKEIFDIIMKMDLALKKQMYFEINNIMWVKFYIFTLQLPPLKRVCQYI